jgi:integrase
MSKRKQRIRSPHPGVVLLQRTLPSGKTAWQARYKDPDSGKLKKPMLDSIALPTHEARRLWAIQRSKTIAKRRMELEAGAQAVETRQLAIAIDDYVDNAKKRLRAKTLTTYRLAFDPFLVWCTRHGIRTTADITRSKLAAFRDTLIARTKHSAKKGGKRGEADATDRRRSPVSINRELRTLKTLLNAWRQAGLLSITRDAITDTLKALPVAREQPEYLNPAQIKKLLEAAARHDTATFKETREEHAGKRQPGTTKRYTPIAPFTAFLLLTGCRRGEALALTWSDVDLDALDHDGRKVGEIRLKAEATKTMHARTVGLEVSPALKALLAAMKLKAIGSPFVFGGASPYTVDAVESARARMIDEYGAPKFDWQMLRSTCSTYLTNAQGIFGSATVFLSAKQLGHSVMVAERHYLNVHRGIPRDARTLEAAMQIEDVMPRLTTAPAETRSPMVGTRRRHRLLSRSGKHGQPASN